MIRVESFVPGAPPECSSSKSAHVFIHKSSHQSYMISFPFSDIICLFLVLLHIINYYQNLLIFKGFSNSNELFADSNEIFSNVETSHATKK